MPFAPFPAVALMPVVAVLGAVGADQAESGINAVLAAMGVGLCWVLLARIGVRRLVDRLALTILFGFSTQILWVTDARWRLAHRPAGRDDPDVRCASSRSSGGSAPGSSAVSPGRRS